jgi:predicted nucleotidyltransferase
VKRITGAFESRVSDPMTFARETRMLLLSVESVDVNVAVALQGYEESLFERCKSIEIDPGRVMQICSAEDLIIHKALACRSQDFADIQGVIYRQGSKLDVRYIRSWLRDFSQALGDETILDRFEKAWGQR